MKARTLSNGVRPQCALALFYFGIVGNSSRGSKPWRSNLMVTVVSRLLFLRTYKFVGRPACYFLFQRLLTRWTADDIESEWGSDCLCYFHCSLWCLLGSFGRWRERVGGSAAQRPPRDVTRHEQDWTVSRTLDTVIARLSSIIRLPSRCRPLARRCEASLAGAA